MFLMDNWSISLREDSQIDFFMQSVHWTLGGWGFADGHFKKSVKNQFLTNQIFEIYLFFSAFITVFLFIILFGFFKKIEFSGWTFGEGGWGQEKASKGCYA